MMKLVDSWTKHRTQTRLVELVEGVYRLWQVGHLDSLLGTIPNISMDPSSKTNLLNIISKVARYREAARFLYRTAKKSSLARNMKIVLVNLPEEAFQKGPINQYTPTLSSTISRIGTPHGQWNLSHICTLLKTTKLEASQQFVQQTKKTLKEAEIHAEIQLLFYCELLSSKLPPRVICSSKDACFLCNAFILMHGKMHMPRYHGRLYPGWRLPLFPKLADRRFNEILEQHIRDSLRMLLSRKQKTVYPDPNESTILTLPLSISTSRSLALSDIMIEEEREIIQPQENNEIAIEKSHAIPSNTQAPSASSQSENIPSSESALQTEGGGPKGDVKNQSSNVITSQLVPSIVSSLQGTLDGSGKLIQGQMLSRSIRVGHTSRLWTTGSLEFQIEYSTDLSLVMSSSPPRKVAYEIEWLTGNEADRLQGYRKPPIIDAESMDGEIPHELDDQNCLYIAARGSVLKIHLITGKENI